MLNKSHKNVSTCVLIFMPYLKKKKTIKNSLKKKLFLHKKHDLKKTVFSHQYVRRSAKIFILNKEGINEKISYERRAYESVDKKSPS